GGVYRVVRAALGRFFGKVAVSALMFDYILTGPTSGVAAGQYIMGLAFQILKLTLPTVYGDLCLVNDDYRRNLRNWGSVLIACLVTVYFFRQHLFGLPDLLAKAFSTSLSST